MKNQIAIRAYYWNKESQVYIGTLEEWQEYLNREVKTVEDVTKGFKYKECGLDKVKPALRYKKDEVKSIEPFLVEIRKEKERKEKMLQEQRTQEQRISHQKYVEELLLKNPIIQLGKSTQIAGKNFFKVEFELETDETVTREILDTVKDETGLNVRIRVAVIKHDFEYADVDPTRDGYGGYEFTEVVKDVQSYVEYEETIY